MKLLFQSTLLVTTIFATTFSVTLGAQQAKKNEVEIFHIYGNPLPGTKFKRKILSGPIPFDKPYSQLTDYQKALVRMDYEGMPSNETPPYPFEGTVVLYEPVIKALQKILKEGDLTAIAMVNHKGDVEEVTVYKSPDPFFAELLNSILFSTKFEPATCKGKPCKMEFFFNLRLNVSPN